MNKIQKQALPPGSDLAVENGCTCPVIDNARGAGAGTGTDGQPMFWYSADCKLHGHLVPAELP